MSDLIMQGAIFGGVVGVLLVFSLNESKKAKQNSSREPTMNSKEQQVTESKRPLLSKWSIRLSLVGVALGILTTLQKGSLSIGFMIGFSIPFVLILGCIGLVVDYFQSKK